ncbi:MAG: FIST N-terminal domain-containing protein [Ferruginibacter sp.]
MQAKSIIGKSTAEIKAALDQSIAEGYKPTLAFVFMSLKQEWPAVQALLNQEGIAIFGATTAEAFTEKGISNAGITLLLLDIDPHYFKLVFKDFEQSSPFQSAGEIAETGLSSFPNPAFIIVATVTKSPGNDIIYGIEEKAGADVTIIGGLAGDTQKLEGTVFTNNTSGKNGILCLVLDKDKIEVKGLAVSGWKPLGTVKKVTKSEGLWIHTIDDQPAMDVVEKYTGNLTMDSNETNKIVKLNSTYPLQVNRQESGQTMIPTLFLNKETRAVMCGQQVPAGTTFRFSLPPDFDVIDTVVESSRSVKENNFPEADALLIFSCVGRLESLGPMISEELQGLARTWEKPMAGFFSLGEFGSIAGGKPEFHGTTCSWVALKEK